MDTGIPLVMQKAKEIGLEKAVKVEASVHNMKLTQAKEKALGLDQGIGYEMALTRDRLFDQPRKKPNDEN